ncbi:MAG: hypothetical protein GEV07_29765 [Streptosporangiales bacterium]|nr:hypothetical protein [Streptosporangiales bacterium]
MNASDVPKQEPYLLVSPEALRATVESIFESVGFPSTDARRSADALVAADLRGVESHGVSKDLSEIE